MKLYAGDMVTFIDATEMGVFQQMTGSIALVLDSYVRTNFEGEDFEIVDVLMNGVVGTFNSLYFEKVEDESG
jgi:hypothetical protein